MRDLAHAPAHIALNFARMFGPILLVVAVVIGLGSDDNGAGLADFFAGWPYLLCAWLLAEFLHLVSAVGDDDTRDRDPNCLDRPRWLWEVWSEG
jgi:hypothetical protein